MATHWPMRSPRAWRAFPSLIVRPSSTLMSLPIAQMDPLSVGQKLLVSLRARRQFSSFGDRLRPQLAAARCRLAERALRRFHQRRLTRPDRRPDRNFQRGLRRSPRPWRGRPDRRASPDPLATARCPGPSAKSICRRARLLSSFMVRTGSKADLDRAHALFTSVTTEGSRVSRRLDRPGHRRTAICAPRLRRTDPRDARAPRFRRSAAP